MTKQRGRTAAAAETPPAQIPEESEEVSAAAPNGTGTDMDTGDGTAAAPDIAALIAERDTYLEQLRRNAADFANYRRRVEQERMLIRQQLGRDLLAQLVPVLDDFQRALAAVPADQRQSGWVAGAGLIERKLAGILERAGVRPIEALGQPFDPARHEAVATEPGTAGDTVVEVYQSGYLLGDSLLRPAMVKVGGKPVA